jgi:transposase InsO family protein
MMATEKASYPVTMMARLLKIDRQRFYDWQARDTKPLTATELTMNMLVSKVKQVHADSDGTYGARRVRADLASDGTVVSLKTVAKAMRLAGVEGISPRTWHPATTIRGDAPFPIDDQVKRRFDMGGKDMAWFSDITYLAFGHHWAYLCCVRDGHTRRVLGRVIAATMTTDLVEATLRQAVTLRGQLPEQVIFHADRGCQYTSRQIADVARGLGILQSMGRTGVCWDNAQAESFWSTFKNEYYYRNVFTTLDQLRRETYVWIDSWYNARRRHSSIGYLSPLDYERQLIQKAEK